MNNPRDESSWRRHYPFASNWFEQPDGRMHFVDESPTPGAPTALLFVHGNPTWSFHWRRLVTGLADRVRCVAPDHLGCGLSDKPDRAFRLSDRIEDLLRLVDALGLKRVTLVAQDWGGAIGLGAMLQRPGLLERLLLFNTGAFPPPYLPRRIAFCRTPGLGRFAVQGANLFTLAALRMTLARSRALPDDVAQGYLAPYPGWSDRRAVYEFVADIPRSPRHPTWGVLERIESGLPTLASLPIRLVWGMRDWCFRPDCLERFLGHWPDAEAVRIPDAGHWVVEDAPDECLRHAREFLTTDARLPTDASLGVAGIATGGP